MTPPTTKWQVVRSQKLELRSRECTLGVWSAVSARSTGSVGSASGRERLHGSTEFTDSAMQSGTAWAGWNGTSRMARTLRPPWAQRSQVALKPLASWAISCELPPPGYSLVHPVVTTTSISERLANPSVTFSFHRLQPSPFSFFLGDGASGSAARQSPDQISRTRQPRAFAAISRGVTSRLAWESPTSATVKVEGWSLNRHSCTFAVSTGQAWVSAN